MAYKWRPLVRVTEFTRNPKVVRMAMERYGYATEAEAVAELNRHEAGCEYYTNDLYQVELRRFVLFSDQNTPLGSGSETVSPDKPLENMAAETVNCGSNMESCTQSSRLPPVLSSETAEPTAVFGEIPMISLNIRRRDGAPIHDWRHLQQIKNELTNPECEGVEIYPAMSRLVDTSNKYHIWVFADPAFRLPFGFAKRDVQYEPNTNVPGIRQRPKTWDIL